MKKELNFIYEKNSEDKLIFDLIRKTKQDLMNVLDRNAGHYSAIGMTDSIIQTIMFSTIAHLCYELENESKQKGIIGTLTKNITNCYENEEFENVVREHIKKCSSN